MGISLLLNPYTIQRINPACKTNNIAKETSSAFFSLSVLNTCGSNEHAVQTPAANPMICVQFMLKFYKISANKFCTIVLMRVCVLMLLLTLLFACKRKWTAKDRSDFYSGCLSNATTNKDIKDPRSYCNCLLQKIVARYPNANDAKYIRYDSTVKQLARDCLK